VNTLKTCILINWKIQKKIDKFVDEYDLLKLNQEDINHLKRFPTSNDIEVVIKSLPKNKIWDQIDSLMNSSRHLKMN
jgi:hypothetical protein